MTQSQIINDLSQYKSTYSRIYKTRCIDGMYQHRDSIVFVDSIGMSIDLKTGMVSNLLRNEKTYNWIDCVVYGQMSPEKVFMLTGETVNYEMLTKENLEKVLVKFGGMK